MSKLSAPERLIYCRVCKNQIFTRKDGYICRITQKQPLFKTHCSNFNLNKQADKNAIKRYKAFPGIVAAEDVGEHLYYPYIFYRNRLIKLIILSIFTFLLSQLPLFPEFFIVFFLFQLLSIFFVITNYRQVNRKYKHYIRGLRKKGVSKDTVLRRIEMHHPLKLNFINTGVLIGLIIATVLIFFSSPRKYEKYLVENVVVIYKDPNFNSQAFTPKKSTLQYAGLYNQDWIKVRTGKEEYMFTPNLYDGENIRHVQAHRFSELPTSVQNRLKSRIIIIVAVSISWILGFLLLQNRQ